MIEHGACVDEELDPPEVHLKVFMTHEVNKLDLFELAWGPVFWCSVLLHLQPQLQARRETGCSNVVKKD